MHPLVKKAWEIGQELGMNQSALTRAIGLSGQSVLHRWLKDEKTPRKPSIDKLQKFIKRYEAGDRFQPKPKPKLKNIPVKNIPEDKRIIYEYIFYLEEKYGKLHKADDNDPVLIKLRKEAGA